MMTAVYLRHVLTQDLAPTRVLVTKDILVMERLVKVTRLSFTEDKYFAFNHVEFIVILVNLNSFLVLE